jgi:hypothetical protein
MRLWSLHPGLLDRQGLTACWREALLAQAVLGGRTRGYTAHPQLERFRTRPDPLAAIGAYLAAISADASRRGYRFDANRIQSPPPGNVGHAPLAATMTVTAGQLEWEWGHLLRKLEARSPLAYADALASGHPVPHPLFVVVPGERAAWERGT